MTLRIGGGPPSPFAQEGRRLRDARLEVRLSLREVASRLGIDVVRYGEIERGLRAPEGSTWAQIETVIRRSPPT